MNSLFSDTAGRSDATESKMEPDGRYKYSGAPKNIKNHP